MKDMKLSKILTIILIVIIQSFLVDAGWFSVGLRNVDSNNPLVNIEKLIGGGEMPDIPKIPQPKPKPEPKAEPKQKPTVETEPDPNINSKITVSVKGKTIQINNKKTVELSFENQFEELYDDSMQVVLIDDYADYQSYSKILEYFKTKGIKIKEEPSYK